MARDGRNVRVKTLNERRLQAVKHRLAGLSAAEAARKTGLSVPTVLRAHKAYDSGGWAAVPVAPRGRGARKPPAAAGHGAALRSAAAPQGRADADTRADVRADTPGDRPPETGTTGDAGDGTPVREERPSRPSPRRARAERPLGHLQRLEAESIHIMREVVAEADRPVMLYSIGKDSAVLLHLARKAFYPGRLPFPLLHVDTTWKFREMYELRERVAAEPDVRLIVHVNRDGLAKGVNPFTHGSAIHTDIMKTQALRQALDAHGFDAAFGGARRDEEKSRAKERILSFRTDQHRWDPKNQRPELWRLYNTRKHPGESFRVFPLSNWTELDVWQYIHAEGIEVVPLYFAKPRPVVERNGTLIMVDDERMPLGEREVPRIVNVRFRTLGCYPLTGAIPSRADTLPLIIEEMLAARHSERQGRVIDHDGAASMERKKQEGYF